MPALNEVPFKDHLLAVGNGAPSVEEKMHLVQMARGESPEIGKVLDLFLLEQIDVMKKGLLQAQKSQKQLRESLKRMTAPPWFPAIFLGCVATPQGLQAEVMYGNSHRIVSVSDEVDRNSLSLGDQVYLGQDLNLLVALSPTGCPKYGETAHFERAIPDGRIVLKWRDDEVVVNVADRLKSVDLEEGDLVRWDRSVWIAYEQLENVEGKRYLLNEIPDLNPDQVGGQDANLEELLMALTSILIEPGKAESYLVGGRQSVLMVGAPGCGKTLMARVAASEIARISGQTCRFCVVKPSEWEDPYVGVTQKNIRRCFDALREASESGLAVMFLDEVESVGRHRGSAVGQHSDKFLGALLAEMDGFLGRERVAIIAATNRKDLIDPALLERLSDLEIQVERPDLSGTRSIFNIHLPVSLPYNPNGSGAADTRQEIIETAVSRLFSPNSENQLCRLKFRDGKTRVVEAREIISGRLIEQICRLARRKAFYRDLRGGTPGVCVADMQSAVSSVIRRLATTLTPRNAHAYLFDLPQDVDVVSVERNEHHQPLSQRYIAANSSS